MIYFFFCMFLFTGLVLSNAQTSFQSDTVKTSDGDLVMTFIGHGTLMFKFKDLIVHVDPVSREADYEKLPKADIILVTHEHGDHLDADAIARLKKEDTAILITQKCKDQGQEGVVMRIGERKTLKSLSIEAMPAYNIVHKRQNGQPFHPKGNGNGYIIQFGDKRVYVAGDTENIPEMKKLSQIDIAFLPMNLPYTMSPEMVADAARAFKPGILYPYHYGNTDPQKLVELLKDAKEIKVRIRDLR